MHGLLVSAAWAAADADDDAAAGGAIVDVVGWLQSLYLYLVLLLQLSGCVLMQRSPSHQDLQTPKQGASLNSHEDPLQCSSLTSYALSVCTQD